MNPRGFNERARPAIADETLQRALAKVLNTFRVACDRALSGVDEAGLHRRARDIRDEALTHLDQYLPQLADNATRNGMIVHWAGDAAEANRTVIEIARSHGFKRVVKSKSMLTEEIGLNHALEKAGVSVVGCNFKASRSSISSSLESLTSSSSIPTFTSEGSSI